MNEAVQQLHAEREKLEDLVRHATVEFEERTRCVVQKLEFLRMDFGDRRPLLTGVTAEVHL